MRIIYRPKMATDLVEVILNSLRILNMDSLNHKIRRFSANLKGMMSRIRLILCKHQLTSKIIIIKKMISKHIRQILKMEMIWVR
jgi:hypothetical protein